MSAATITLLFLLFAVVMFVFEKIPLGVTSMIVCIGLVVTGVLDIKTAFAGFIDSKRFAVLVRAVGDWGGEGVHSLSILHQDTKDVLVAKHVAYLDKIGMSCHNHRNGALAQVCYASYPHSMVFRANGKIGKCTVALDHPQNQLGWVDPEKGIVIDPEVNCRWSFSDLKPECRSCRNVLRCMNMQCKKSEIIDGKTVCLYRKSECV